MDKRSHADVLRKIQTGALLLALTMSVTPAYESAAKDLQRKPFFVQRVVETLQLKASPLAAFAEKRPTVTTAQETTSGLKQLPTKPTGSSLPTNYLRSLTSEEQARVRMLTQTRKSVVSVVSTDPKNNLDEYLSRLSSVRQDYETLPKGPTLAFSISQGSGFFVSSDGMLATSKHVVGNTKHIYRVVTSDNRVYEVDKILRDPLLDLALIQIKNPDKDVLTPVNFVDKNIAPLIGQTVFSIGNTLGKYPNTVSQGIISEVSRTVTAYGEEDTVVDLFDMIQTDAAISQGNSGGPLIDSKGRVVGLNTAFDQDGENIGFAIPSMYIQSAMESVRKHGLIIKPLLGVQYIMLDGYMTKTYKIPVSNGAYVLQDDGDSAGVLRGSPAEKAGIVPGDIITKVNDIALNQNMTLMNAVTKLRGEDKVKLTIYRAGKELQVEIPIEQAP